MSFHLIVILQLKNVLLEILQFDASNHVKIILILIFDLGICDK